MVTALLLLLLACEPAPPAARDAPPAARDAAPDARDAGQTAAPPPPPGRIGGGAILDRPVVLGGIENAAVEGALDLAAAAACNTAGRPGKVLLRFHIDRAGPSLPCNSRRARCATPPPRPASRTSSRPRPSPRWPMAAPPS